VLPPPLLASASACLLPRHLRLVLVLVLVLLLPPPLLASASDLRAAGSVSVLVHRRQLASSHLLFRHPRHLSAVSQRLLLLLLLLLLLRVLLCRRLHRRRQCRSHRCCCRLVSTAPRWTCRTRTRVRTLCRTRSTRPCRLGARWWDLRLRLRWALRARAACWIIW